MIIVQVERLDAASREVESQKKPAGAKTTMHCLLSDDKETPNYNKK